MHLFYTPDIHSNFYSFNEEEARHCSKVLRLQKGEIVQLTDGKGNLFTAQINQIGKNSCEVEIIKTQNEFGKRNFYLHIAIAPTKNIDRFEWFLEKATEMGIDEITPLICERSVREKLRFDRLTKVITSAMKQSLKAYHPKLNEASPLSSIISREETFRLIAHCYDNQLIPIQQFLSNQLSILRKNNSSSSGSLGGASFLILIGPEGDFSLSEVELAIKNGFIPVSLGKSRLRTETAGIYSCAVVNSINENIDWR